MARYLHEITQLHEHDGMSIDTLTIDFDVVSPEIHHDLEHERLRCANDFTYQEMSLATYR